MNAHLIALSHVYCAIIHLCGGGFEYLHCRPASHRRQQRGIPVPEGITGPLSSWGILIWSSGPPGWSSLGSEKVKYGLESPGTGPENDCAGEGQKQS
jgi:hypothetical protein